MRDDGLYAAMVRRGMTRRTFLQFTAAMAAALSLPAAYGPRIAKALESAPRVPVLWIRGQACGGNTEAMLRSYNPTAAQLLLDVLSVDYHDELLAVAGGEAVAPLAGLAARYPKGYYAVLEGSFPTGASGAYCLIGGRPAVDIAREVCAGALLTVAVGSCAVDGGAPAASGGPTEAGGIGKVLSGGNYIALPGCPANPVNLAAVIVHQLVAKETMPTDLGHRPLAFYGNLIHNQCERRPHFEFGEFAQEWGDQGSQKGWCLYKLGCKGPETMANCPEARYGEKISWNVSSGVGCIGCHSPSFWNAMGPAYRRLPSPLPFLPNLTTDMVGGAMVAGIGGVAGAHAVGMTIRFKRYAAQDRRTKARAAAAAAEQAAADQVPHATDGSAQEPVPAGVDAGGDSPAAGIEER
jgi:hydrogenase small subunit